MRKILGIGETIYDILFRQGQPVAAVPGGSVFNGLISLGRTGLDCTFITEVGDDQVGQNILAFMQENGINTDYVSCYQGKKTAISLAYLNEHNDAKYSFYKDYPNNRLDFTFPEIKQNDIVAFGAYFALNPVLKSKVHPFLEYAKKQGAILYYDLNFRDNHAHEVDSLKETFRENFALADIVRGSHEDFINVFGFDDCQKIYLETMSEIRSHNMMTFPVSTISLLYQDGEFVDDEFAHWAIQHNMKWSDSNLFVDDSVNSLSNCCRLKSDIRDLGYFNSIGGTALKVGSVKVNTINLARLALDTNSEEEYLIELERRATVCLQALDCVRHIIKRNVDKGLLPNFKYGLIDFEHLYNTIGFLGVYETMKHFGYITKDELGNTFYTENAAKFGEKIFQTIRRTADNFIDAYGLKYKINTEQIPGETAADKLMKKDKFFYPNADIYDLPLYGNQFIPLGIKTTLQERVRIQAQFDHFCNGGSILHANIDAPFSNFDQAWKMVKYIADQGVTYFAFNTKIQVCEDNHAFYGTTCPVCGKPIAGEYTRVVGFYTPIRTWSAHRKLEYNMRRWEPINDNKRIN